MRMDMFPSLGKQSKVAFSNEESLNTIGMLDDQRSDQVTGSLVGLQTSNLQVSAQYQYSVYCEYFVKIEAYVFTEWILAFDW